MKTTLKRTIQCLALVCYWGLQLAVADTRGLQIQVAAGGGQLKSQQLQLQVAAPSYITASSNGGKNAAAPGQAAAPAQFDFAYLEGIREFNSGHFTAAMQLFQACVRADSTAAAAHFKLGDCYAVADLDSIAALCYARAAALEPDNDTYTERLARQRITQHDYTGATLLYERLAKAHPRRTDVLNLLLRLYAQADDTAQMLDVLRRIELAEGDSEELALTRMRVYEMRGDKRAAENTLRSLAEKHPYDIAYRVMLGNWLSQNNKRKEALHVLEEAVREEPYNADALTSLCDHYDLTDDARAEALRERLLLAPQIDDETSAATAMQLIKDVSQHKRDSADVRRLLDAACAAKPKSDDLRFVRAALLQTTGAPQDSINAALREVLAINPEFTTARRMLINTALQAADWKTVAALCQEGALYEPTETVFYYFLGVARFQMDDNKGALEAFQSGAEQLTKDTDKDIAADLYALQGDILHQEGHSSEAYAAYEQCLTWKPDHISCLNNYAYYLSEENRELPKAEQMSRKTINAEPRNGTYLDTYAWILFLEGRYDEAQVYIQQALEQDTVAAQSAIILEHAGDIHAQAGDMGRAVYYWEKAAKAGDGATPLLPKKIKQKKYIKE